MSGSGCSAGTASVRVMLTDGDQNEAGSSAAVADAASWTITLVVPIEFPDGVYDINVECRNAANDTVLDDNAAAARFTVRRAAAAPTPTAITTAPPPPTPPSSAPAPTGSVGPLQVSGDASSTTTTTASSTTTTPAPSTNPTSRTMILPAPGNPAVGAGPTGAVASALSVVPGDVVEIRGEGFAPGQTLRVDFDGTNLGSIVADAAGQYATTVTVPAGTVPGSHRFVVSGLGPLGDVQRTLAPLQVTTGQVGAAVGVLPRTGESDNARRSAGLAVLLVGAVLLVAVRSPTRRRQLADFSKDAAGKAVILVVIIAVLAPAPKAKANSSHLSVVIASAVAREIVTGNGGAACQFTVTANVTEFGQDRVTRLKARAFLMGPNDPGFPFLDYRSTSYQYSFPFPNDFRNFSVPFTFQFIYFVGTTVKVRVKGVGERPFPHFDRVSFADTMPLGCGGGGDGFSAVS